jgi:LITAF-like zinc ribbon protein
MQQAPQYDLSPPRPYAWKTDEFQTQAEPRHQEPPLSIQQNYASPPAAFRFAAMDGSYRCPRCGTSYLPVLERRVSTAGWIVFSVLLVFTFVFFWIGLLMKEDVAVCPVCRGKLT